MSYFDYPRLHFSGRFKASPSTINNTPNNYDPTIYPTPNQLQDVELYWNPKGNGGFAFADCVVTRVDYADGTSSTTPAEDPIIGQPFASIKNPSFPLEAGLVDLDPMQQNVSEIWAMGIQIGGAANLVGKFTAISFYAIWGQAQGANAPHSSASGSGVYQSTLKDIQLNGDAGTSRFLKHFADHPASKLSINFNLNTHNNKPPIWRFNSETFQAMQQAGVPSSVLKKIEPMQQLVQNLDENFQPVKGSPRGDVPVLDFVLFMLQQYLTTAEYNANIDTIVKTTEVSYTGATTEDFLYGLTTGTVGPACDAEPTFFVANRMMNPQGASGNPTYFAPFVLSGDGKTISLNLGNSLPTELPGTTPWSAKLGQLWLVAFPTGAISVDDAKRLVEIPYADPGFITQRAGLFTAKLDADYSQTPLGLLSVFPDATANRVMLAEDPNGYYLRADQFVFRMNPGVPSTADSPRGETARAGIHALKFGKPVPDGTSITVTMMTEEQAETYTAGTLGTSGTNGIKNLSIPQEALNLNGQPHSPNQPYSVTATTTGGVACFDLTCTPPGNPRKYLDGQIYFLKYGFADPTISNGYIQDPNDLISVQVYDEITELEAPDVLAKFGRLYKIMNFLTDREKISQIDLRNMIKLLLEKPFTELQHMPVTRDLGASARKKIIDWINALNNS
jgi:hypothetical protein